MRSSCLALAFTVISGAFAWPAESALPPAFGGTVRWPAHAALRVPRPTALRTPFEAALSDAVFDTLYDVDERLRPIPILAESLPALVEAPSGDRWQVQLRENLRLHGRGTLSAQNVVDSLRRAHRSDVGWWLTPLEDREGELDIQVVNERTLSFPARRGVNVARLLAAAPLAIVAGSRNRPAGTGSFSARVRQGDLRLSTHRHAARGAPYLQKILIAAPRRREPALRAFELRRVQGSWWGASLYRGPERARTPSTQSAMKTAVMIVPGGSDIAFSTLALLVDRERLARVGIAPAVRLDARLAPPRVPPRPASQPRTISMRIDGSDPLHARIADALTAILDESNVALRPQTSGASDITLKTVLPGLPGLSALVATAFANAGQTDEARALTLRDLRDADYARGRAPELRAIVLGSRRDVLHHRAVRGVRYDARGRLQLRELHLPRPTP